MKGEGNVAPRMLMAYAPNGDFAILDLDRSPVDLSERDVGGRAPAQAADAFVYTAVSYTPLTFPTNREV